MGALKEWMSAATSEEQKALARLASTSRGHLYQLSAGHRSTGPVLARNIETASRELHRQNKNLPILSRTKLCPACGECDLAKRCTPKK